MASIPQIPKQLNQYGHRRFGYDLLAFALPIIVVIIAFWSLQIAPFGHQNLLISDMGTQYVAWLTQFRHAITTGQFSFYSFSLSLGDNAFPLVAYYLLSPFNLLLFFFPASEVPLAVTYIILLKIGSIGLSTAYFLRRVYHNTSWSNLIFATIFSLSGFVATYFYDIMWLDALILLPLVMLGVRQLVAHKSPTLYFFALWATIVSNYYLGYMTCLFVVCYFIYLIVEQTPNQTWRQRLHDNKQLNWRFIGVSALSGFSTLFVLLPTLLGMLQTSKQSLSWRAFLPTAQFGPAAFTQFGMNASDYTNRLQHDPSVYMASLGFLLFISFFLNPRIDRRHKRTTAGLLGFLVLGMFLTGFNTIWHMLQPPNGFPFRDAYFFTFIALLCAYESWQAGIANDRHQLNWALGITTSLLSLGYVTALIFQPILLRHDANTSFYVNPRFWLISLLGLLTCWALLWLSSTPYIKTVAITCLAILTVTELGANLYFGLQPAHLGNQTAYEKNYQIEQRYFRKIRRDSSAFYRVDNRNSLINEAYGESYNNYNDPLLFNSHGLDLYSSTLNESTRQTLKRLGFYSKNSRRISSEGSTHLTNALFAVKYELQMTPAKYTLNVHRHALPLGFAASDHLVDTKLTPDAAIQNQNNLWQAINGSHTNYFKPVKVHKAIRRQTSDKQYHYTYSLSAQANGTLYAYFPDVDVAAANIHVNGTKKSTRLNIDSQAMLSLGRFKTGTPVTLTLTSPKPIETPQNWLQTLDQRAFDKSLLQLHQSTLKLAHDWRPDRLHGTIQIKRDKPWLFLSIPHDAGWHMYVDGVDAPVKKVAGNMSAIKLTQGHHRIRLVYRAPGFRLGVILSLLSFFLFLLYFWVDYRRQHLVK